MVLRLNGLTPPVGEDYLKKSKGVLAMMGGARFQRDINSVRSLRNDPEALKAIRSAAEHNGPAAQFVLGMAYGEGMGVVQDYGQALKWFRSAAEQGNAQACAWLGMMHASGRRMTKNAAEARKWLRKAADAGDATAKQELEKMSRTRRTESTEDE